MESRRLINKVGALYLLRGNLSTGSRRSVGPLDVNLQLTSREQRSSADSGVVYCSHARPVLLLGVK